MLNNYNWNGDEYRKLLEKQQLTSEEMKQLQFYRIQVYLQICYNSKNKFTSLISKYLWEKMDPNEFRINFIDLCGENSYVASLVELDPTQLTNLRINFNPNNSFFDLKFKMLNTSITMIQEYDSEFLMPESDFQTLVERFYLDTLFSKNV